MNELVAVVGMLVLCGVPFVAVLAACGRGDRSRKRSWFDIPR